MRAYILLGLSALSLAACDSAYGPPPSTASNKNFVTTGSHLAPSGDQQPSNVQVLKGDGLSNSTNRSNSGKTSGGS